MPQEYLALKWGDLKAWKIYNTKARCLLERWRKISVSAAAASPEAIQAQKDLVCEIIDAVECDQVYMVWDGVYVSKAAAKTYVRHYAEQ